MTTYWRALYCTYLLNIGNYNFSGQFKCVPSGSQLTKYGLALRICLLSYVSIRYKSCWANCLTVQRFYITISTNISEDMSIFMQFNIDKFSVAIAIITIWLNISSCCLSSASVRFVLSYFIILIIQSYLPIIYWNTRIHISKCLVSK